MGLLRQRLLLSAFTVFFFGPLLYSWPWTTEQARHAEISLDTDARFWAALTGSDDPWLVEFYDPRCSSCQAFAPVWHQLAGLPWAGGMRFATVSIEERPGMDLAQRLGVIDEGLPNVRLFLPRGEHADDEEEEQQRPRDERGRPKQHRVMGGGRESGLTASMLKQKVLSIIHKAQLEELGIDMDEPEPVDDPASASGLDLEGD
jgi:thiol-disulfide isomerase/thioredoxin